MRPPQSKSSLALHRQLPWARRQVHPPYTLVNSVVLLSNLKDLTAYENLPSALLKDRHVCPVEWFLECPWTPITINCTEKCQWRSLASLSSHKQRVLLSPLLRQMCRRSIVNQPHTAAVEETVLISSQPPLPPSPQMPFCPFTVVYTFHGNPSWQKTFPWQHHSIGKSRFHSGEDRRSPFSNVQSTMMIISEWKSASHTIRSHDLKIWKPSCYWA